MKTLIAIVLTVSATALGATESPSAETIARDLSQKLNEHQSHWLIGIHNWGRSESLYQPGTGYSLMLKTEYRVSGRVSLGLTSALNFGIPEVSLLSGLGPSVTVKLLDVSKFTLYSDLAWLFGTDRYAMDPRAGLGFELRPAPWLGLGSRINFNPLRNLVSGKTGIPLLFGFFDIQPLNLQLYF